MKKLNLSILIFLTNLVIYAQQNQIGTTGNVGIGTTNPSAILDVEKNHNGTTFIEVNNSSEGNLARRGISIGNGLPGNSVYLLSTSPNYNEVSTWTRAGVLGTDSQLSNGLILRSSVGKIRFQPGGIDDKIVFTQSGNVGIGTTAPKSKLDIGTNYSNPSTYPNKITLWSGGANNYFGFGISNGDLDYFSQSNHRFYTEYNGTPGTEKMVIQSNGYVGIGISNPKSKLDIGTNYSNPSIYPNKITLWSGGPNNYFGFGISNGDLDYFSQSNHRFYTEYNGTPGTEKMVIESNGNVGIGTTTPNGWKLAVNGKIRAKEIKVETGWSDFVFYDTYRLPTLDEVEHHIKEKGHLKDIPSAKEVEENGIFLGEMDAKLLQKIEELTLYTIQQQKEIEQQNSALAKQEKEILELKLMVKELLESKK